MINVDINTDIILHQQRNLEAALSTNPDTEKALRKLIHKEILAARAGTVSAIKGELKNDPRQAYKAVRTTVYKKVLGANISLFKTKHAHGSNSYEPERTLNPSKPGGNRRKRNSRTQQIMSYAPLDRGFILDWVNRGTFKGIRHINFTPDPHREEVSQGKRGGDKSKYGKKPNSGQRGKIDGKGFFQRKGRPELAKAVDNLSRIIESELADILSGKKKVK